MCLDTLGNKFGQNAGVKKCKVGHAQIFLLNSDGQLSAGEHCLVSENGFIKNRFCIDGEGFWYPFGEWKYIEVQIID